MTIDEHIIKVQEQLDVLRNRDHVPEHRRRLYYRAIADAEKLLDELLKQKETNEHQESKGQGASAIE